MPATKKQTPKKGGKKKKNKKDISTMFTDWIGSESSLLVHTIFFIGSFATILFGADLEEVLLVLTTIVSLEAIYLAIFIQITVNRNTQSLKTVEKDIDEIQEDIDEIQEDIDEIQEDIDEIQEDVDEIQEDVDEIQEDMESIGKDIDEIQEDIDEIQEEDEEEDSAEKTEKFFIDMESKLQEIIKEISELKKITKK